MSFTTPTLTDAQQDAVTFWQAYDVPGVWYVSQPDPDGTVELLLLNTNEDGLTVWAIGVAPDGTQDTSQFGPDYDGGLSWSTGIDI